MLKAGFAEAVITPQEKCFLAGYGGPWSTGVHDDLYASAVYLEDGETKALLVSFDLIGMEPPLIATIKASAARAVDVAPGLIFFTCTHTHEGPETRPDALSPEGAPLSYLDGYVRLLAERVGQIATEARSRARECDVRVNRAFVDENLNRRYFMPSGQHFYVPNYKDLIPITYQHEDKELGLVYFCPVGDKHPFGMILNYTMHPLTAGNTTSLVSADVPGVVRNLIAEGLSCFTCYVNGAAGDNHPKAPEGGFAETRRVAGVLATEAIKRWYDAYKLEGPLTLKGLTRSVTLRNRTEGELRGIPNTGDVDEDRLQAYLRRIKHPGAAVDVEFSLLAIGPILFVGVPGEMVSELGRVIKWYSPFQRTYVMYQATDSLGYIAHPNAYQWGGYEAMAGQLSPASPRRLVDAIIDAAEELAAQ